jgi:hypothetical protein
MLIDLFIITYSNKIRRFLMYRAFFSLLLIFNVLSAKEISKSATAKSSAQAGVVDANIVVDPDILDRAQRGMLTAEQLNMLRGVVLRNTVNGVRSEVANTARTIIMRNNSAAAAR